MMDNEVKEMRAAFRLAIENVMQSGLNSQDPDPYFSKYGCDYCDSELAATVYDIAGYQSLQEAKHKGNLIEFQLCADCLNKLQ